MVVTLPCHNYAILIPHNYVANTINVLRYLAKTNYSSARQISLHTSKPRISTILLKYAIHIKLYILIHRKGNVNPGPYMKGSNTKTLWFTPSDKVELKSDLRW